MEALAQALQVLTPNPPNLQPRPAIRAERTNTMSLILSIEHALAVAIGDLKKSAKVIQGPVLAALVVAHADAPMIEAVSGIVSPQIADLERTGDAVLGVAIKTIGDASAVVNADGSVNITMAAALVSDIKSIAPLVTSAAKSSGVLASTPSAVKSA